jgi:hypothetical protein
MAEQTMAMEPDALVSPANSVATTFECFPELPEELRLQIWSAAMFARVVNIIYDMRKDKFISFNSTVPAVLHTCRESRALALKIDTLKLSFGTKSYSARIYFDFARDILFFDDWNASAQARYLYTKRFGDRSPYRARPYGGNIYPEGAMNENEVRNIERLAVNFEYIQQCGARPEIAALLSRFEKMHTFFVVLESPCLDPTVLKSREAIQFIDIPSITSCELEVEQRCSNVYWNTDQGRVKTVRGLHGMLEFSATGASTRVMRSTRSIIDGRNQAKLSIIRGKHGMLKFAGDKSWTKIVGSNQDSDVRPVRYPWVISWFSRRGDQASSESDAEPLSESDSDEVSIITRETDTLTDSWQRAE